MTAKRPTAGDVAATAVALVACIAITAMLRGDPLERHREFDGLAFALIVVGLTPMVLWRVRPMVPAVSALVTTLVGSALASTFVGPMA